MLYCTPRGEHTKVGHHSNYTHFFFAFSRLLRILLLCILLLCIFFRRVLIILTLILIDLMLRLSFIIASSPSSPSGADSKKPS